MQTPAPIRAHKYTDALLEAERRIAGCALRGTPGDIRAMWAAGLKPEWAVSGVVRLVLTECLASFRRAGSHHFAIPIIAEWLRDRPEALHWMWVEFGPRNTGRGDVELMRRHHDKMQQSPMPPEPATTKQLRKEIDQWLEQHGM